MYLTNAHVKPTLERSRCFVKYLLNKIFTKDLGKRRVLDASLPLHILCLVPNAKRPVPPPGGETCHILNDHKSRINLNQHFIWSFFPPGEDRDPSVTIDIDE